MTETNVATNLNTASPEDEMVMYLIFNSFLNMSKSKVAAQAGHAVAGIIHPLTIFHDNGIHRVGYGYSTPPTKTEYYKWINGSQTKIALKVPEKSWLIDLQTEANKLALYTYLVQDEGLTEIASGSYTVLGIEPLPKSHPFVKEHLSKLRLY